MSAFKIDPEATYFIDTNIWLYAFIQAQNVEKNEMASALDCDADYLISEDMQDGFLLESSFKIINPFA